MTKGGLRLASYQTYRCPSGHSFSDNGSASPFTNSFIEYIVAAYLRSLSLNAVIQIVRLQWEKDVLSKGTVLGFLEKVADRLPSLEEINETFHPKRSGYLAFDGVYFKLEGEIFCILFCFDPETFDVVDYRLAAQESFPEYRLLAQQVEQQLERQGLKATGLYLDGEKSLIQALREVFPGVPQQLCIVHKYLRMGQVIPFKSVHRKSVFYLVRKKILKFKRLFEETIFAPSKEESLRKFKELDYFAKAHSVEKFYRGYRILRRNFHLTLTHFDYPHMQRDNNLIECFNSLISRRLDLFKGFKKEINVDRYLKLLLLDYRFHKLTESRLSYRRDRSPLELAQANIPPHYNFIKMLRQILHLNFEN